jgi:hypothetical protein
VGDLGAALARDQGDDRARRRLTAVRGCVCCCGL